MSFLTLSVQEINIASEFVLEGDEEQANESLIGIKNHLVGFVSILEAQNVPLSEDIIEQLLNDAELIITNLEKTDVESLELLDETNLQPLFNEIQQQIENDLLERQLLIDELENKGVIVSVVVVEESPKVPKIIGELGSVIFDIANIVSNVECGKAISTSINAAAVFKDVDLLSSQELNDISGIASGSGSSSSFCANLSSMAFFDLEFNDLDLQNDEFQFALGEYARTPFVFEKQHSVATALNLFEVREFWELEHTNSILDQIDNENTRDRILDTIRKSISIISGSITGIIFEEVDEQNGYIQINGDNPISEAL